METRLKKNKTKMFSLRLNPDIIRQLKVTCAKNGFSMASTIEGLIKFYLETWNKNERRKATNENNISR
jgi:hypothetical protein